MNKENKVRLYMSQWGSSDNIDSDDYQFAHDYAMKFKKEFDSVKATEIDLEDIMCAVLNGINYNKSK